MTIDPPAPASESPRSARRLRPRTILLPVAGALAGSLVGLDVLLAGVLAALLRGREAEVVQMPGILRGSWSLADGLSVELGVGTLLLPLLGAGVGLCLGLRRVVRRPGRGPGPRA
jgi:hypothetical protein